MNTEKIREAISRKEKLLATSEGQTAAQLRTEIKELQARLKMNQNQVRSHSPRRTFNRLLNEEQQAFISK